MSMRQIYRKVAKKNGVSVAEVKQDMQAAIDYAYKNTFNNSITADYQKQVPHNGEIPTSEELIIYAAHKIKDHQKKC